MWMSGYGFLASKIPTDEQEFCPVGTYYPASLPALGPGAGTTGPGSSTGTDFSQRIR